MQQPVRVIGSYLSPYVRKTLVVLDLKGVAYEIDPITPFLGNDEFSRLSPLRRVPVLIDGQVTLADSSVICQYLEECHPEPVLYPRDIIARAHARWLEEFADTRMGEVLIWGLFNEVVINPYVWGKPTNEDVLQKTLGEDVPHVLDYLESQVPSAGFIFGSVSIADIAIACFFRNAAFARFRVDADRWPLTAAFVERMLRLDSFERLKPFEDRMMRTPPAEQRAALAALGAPLTAKSYGTSSARRGIMRI